MTTALICGATGQDGAYLSQLLASEGCRVVGTTRDLATADRSRVRHLGIEDQVELVALAPDDRAGAARLLADTGATEVYALWGQSSVGRSFAKPAETVDSIVPATLNLLEAVRGAGREVRLFHAGSSECYGELDGSPADETTSYCPTSPYGAAKAAAQMLVSAYRASFGLFAVNGILFNHESPLRPEGFVTRKIAEAVARIAAGAKERLRLGRLDIARDWGWAPDYCDAMRRMLSMAVPQDLVLATGHTRRLDEFVAAAFQAVGLDWRDHVTVEAGLSRPTDPMWSGARSERAAEVLGWRAEVRMAEVARRLVAAAAV